jgi:hypothetical protein
MEKTAWLSHPAGSTRCEARRQKTRAMAFGDITVTLRPIKFAFLVNQYPTPSSRPGPAPPVPEVRFAHDSALEEDGFELSVPSRQNAVSNVVRIPGLLRHHGSTERVKPRT